MYNMEDFAPTAAIVLASAAEALPTCNACRKAPVSSRGYSTCQPCRERRNEAKSKSKERKRQAQLVLLRVGMLANIPAAVGESSSAGKSLKRKAEAEDAADVMERMRKRFKKIEPFAKVDVPPKTTAASADPAEHVFEKFVSATELHKEIKRRYPDNSTSLRLYGTYAIIALPEIDNKARTRIVARDLKDNTSLHFNFDDRKSHRSNDTANTYTISYKCTCRAASTLKRSASDLSLYFGVKNASTADEKPMTECRGRIEISAEDDRSHRLGWLGQRVKVTITHPKKV
ncbi:hypothetical protein FB451DRAFT_388384 [Mycena latifolia]|nr:hypothetical protein FB451DRAFT_388384 [Mycena latifolia]